MSEEIANKVRELLSKREEIVKLSQAWTDSIGHELSVIFKDIQDADMLEELSNIVYWAETNMPKVSPMSAKGIIKDIYKGMTGKMLVPKKLTGEKCPACGNDIYVTSVSALSESAIPWVGLSGRCCNDCNALEREHQERPSNVILYPNSSIHELVKMDYREFLQTEYWQRISTYIKQRDGGECVLCGSRQHLQVHHKNYYHRGYEFEKDLHTLCGDCHAKFHGKGAYA